MNTSTLLAAAARLPERDFALLDLLYQHRYLTRRQIQLLYFSEHHDPRDDRLVKTKTPRTAQRRLQRLREADLLVRRQLTQPDGRRDPEPYYCLSPNGARLVAHRNNLPLAETRKRTADALANPLFVRHALACGDLHCALVRTARTRPCHQCRPEWWRGEHAVSQQFKDRGATVLLCPDGYTRYQARGDIHHLLVEVDLGTMTLPRLRAKLERYRAYARSRAWQSRYPIFPKLLLLTTNDRRITALHAQLEPLPELVLLSTTHADVRQHRPLAPIWRQPGRNQPRPLLEAQP
jgi:hypothetical protein